VSAPLLQLAAAIEVYCLAPIPAGSDELGEELIGLRRTLDRIEVRFSRLAANFAETDEWDREGFVSPIQWLRNACHMASGAASDRICVGAKLPELEKTNHAMTAGEVGFAHLALIARTAEAIQESGRTLDEDRLLEKAREMTITRFRNACLHERHAADPLGFTADQVREVEEKFLELSNVEDGGVWLRGYFDREGGAALRTALEPLARRVGAGDCRKRPQRLADALVELASHKLDDGALPSVGGRRPHLQLTATFETVKGHLGSPAGELEFSVPISADTVERISCDCTLTRVLLGADSIVIDVGRAKRIINGTRRRALHARDRHCRFPGCDRPATWSSAHHLVHWAKGGTTDLDNLVLLCHRHHWLVHEGGWQLAVKEGGKLLAIPPMAAFNNQIRGPSPRAA
jgi:hypothetical protein